MKGIVLAGGSGTRLHPLTMPVSKQLIPIYDKPMVYYPISVLMLAGIREILIITTPHEQALFKRLLGDGKRLGVEFHYAVQEAPNGLAEAFLIGSDFIGDDSVSMILGDNLFFGDQLAVSLQNIVRDNDGCTLFGYRVKNAARYGVAELDEHGKVISIEEKPKHPKSKIAVTGLYFYDNEVIDIARSITPSPRGELEITDVNNAYIKRGRARLIEMGRGMAWLDTGTPDSLLDASHFVQVLQHRQGLHVACLEEIAWRMHYIDTAQLQRLGEELHKSDYGQYLLQCASEG